MIAQLAAIAGIIGAGVIYGTDAFCALVLRPALARVNDAVLTTVAGNVHRFGDRRLPFPGILGLLGALTASVSAGFAGHPLASLLAGAAFVLLAIWLLIYLRVSAPINRVLTAAADAGELLPDARDLQHTWDRVITLRAVLQGLAVAGLGVSLIV